MNTVELNSINLQSIDVASNNVSSIGKFIKRNKGIKLLPKEYQQVEYIESTGTQYIDTGFKANTTTTRAETELQVTNTSRTCGMFGSRNSSTSTNVGSCNVFFLDSNAFRLDWVNGSTSVIFTNVVTTKKYVISITRGTTTINNTIFTSTNTDSINQDYNFYIGAYNRPGGAPSNRFIGRFYWFKIYNNNQLVRDFIPCYRISDNEIGMYDVANDVFYTKQGTGTFLKGPNTNDKEYKIPYIKGHITTSDSTFTFNVDGNSKTIPVDANGDFKLIVKKPITSLSFVGVPQLESLELFAINGVTSFDVDYPTAVSYIRCDSTTKNAKNDVYHIRGTATDNFQFTLKYIDDNNNVTTVTESAVIDGDGKWDVAYSGKKISGLYESFRGKVVKSVIITENCNKVTTMYGAFRGDTIEEVDLSNATLDICTDFNGTFQLTPKLKRINLPKAKFDSQANQRYTFYNVGEIEEINLPNAKFDKCTDITGLFAYCSKLKKVNIPNATFESVTTTANNMNTFQNSNLISELIVPNTSLMSESINFKDNVLDYDSMLRVAGWLKDLTGLTTQTVTFKKATYDALTAEQKATLEGIIVTQKHWTLATA